MTLIHTNIFIFYQTMFVLCQHHKYSKRDVESMYPFERDVFFTMLIEHIKRMEENSKKG